MKKDLFNREPEIKVKTKKFSLKRGVLRICFSWKDEGRNIRGVYLRQRNEKQALSFPFVVKRTQEVYDCRLDTDRAKLVNGFWDVTADVDGEEMMLGGQSSKLKLRLILFPTWTRTKDGHLVYPFVNGKRQFTIQYRDYQKAYDSWAFLMKEYAALACYFLLKPYWDKKQQWLICEKFCTMAQDNGYYFFRYCMENLTDEEKKRIFYVIDKNCPDYEAVKPYEENVLPFMSFRYMIALCGAQLLISSDAIRHFYIWDSPNSVFKVLYQIRKNIVFLQHGVMGFKQCHKTFHKSGGNRMALFVVSSPYEQKIITDYFEYDKEEVIITGLPRWDVLENHASEENREILLMPTWRGWLEDVGHEEFKQSDYYKNYKAFLTNKKLSQMLEKHNLFLKFYIHPKFREYIRDFWVENARIELIPFGSRPLNQLLMSCSLLITDYSSVAWDVYYQNKPVIFYGFDFETYQQLQGSYMDLETEAFGDFVCTDEELFASLEKSIASNFKEEEKYREKKKNLLPLRDHDNSRRIYEKIKATHFPNKLKTRKLL